MRFFVSRKTISLLLSFFVLVIISISLVVSQTKRAPVGYKSKASERPLLPKYTMQQRFGASGSMGATVTMPSQAFYKNGMGWYFTWDGGFLFQKVGDVWKPNRVDPKTRGPLGGTTWIASIPEGSPPPQSPNDSVCLEFKKFIEANRVNYPKGAMWNIYNEVGYDDKGKDPETIAEAIVLWRRCLKSIDSSFQVGTSAVLAGILLPQKPFVVGVDGEVNSVCPEAADQAIIDAGLKGGQRTSNGVPYTRYGWQFYFQKILRTIRTNYPNDIPDFVTAHPYPTCGSASTPFITRTTDFVKKIRQAMKAEGMQDKDLIVTEISDIFGNPSLESQKTFMEQVVNLFTSSKDSSLGNPNDQYRMVQRWAWFIGADAVKTTPPPLELNDWRYVILYDVLTNKYTQLGDKYIELANKYIRQDELTTCTIQGIKWDSLAGYQIRIEDQWGNVRETRAIVEGGNSYQVLVPGNKAYTVSLVDSTTGELASGMMYSTSCINRVDCHTPNDKSYANGRVRTPVNCPTGGYVDIHWTPTIPTKPPEDLGGGDATRDNSFFQQSTPASDGSTIIKDGGPTAVWENFRAQTVAFANKKWVWIYDRKSSTWAAPFDMSVTPSYAVRPVKDAEGKDWYPWTDNGPTSAWTWSVSNDTVQESVLCNRNYCWRFAINLTTGAGDWRDARNGIELPKLNAFWINAQDTYLGGGDALWRNEGLTAVWTRPDQHIAALCNKTFCRTLDYANWKWLGELQIQSFYAGVKTSTAGIRPETGNGFTSGWTSPVTGNVTNCNGTVCWTYDLTAKTWQNEGEAVEFK